MSLSYNRVVYEGLDADGTYIIRDEQTGEIAVDRETLYREANANGGTFTENGVTAKIDNYYLVVTTENGYVEYRSKFSVSDKVVFDIIEYKALETISDNARKNEFNDNLTVDGKTFKESGMTAEEFIGKIQSKKSADAYHAEEKGFLWIKNIWVTDSPMKHPVEQEWSTFKQTHSYNGTEIGDENYKKLINEIGLDNISTFSGKYEDLKNKFFILKLQNCSNIIF